MKFTALALLLFVLPGDARAQDVSQLPRPTAEHQRLGYFVGTWRTDGQVRAGRFSPAGSFTSLDRGEWLDGGFFVVTRATSMLPSGSQAQLSILGWDERQKAYTFTSFNSAGLALTATGTVDGSVWTWSTSESSSGRLRHVRHVITVESPSAYRFRFETSVDGTTWVPFIEGTTVKVS